LHFFTSRHSYTVHYLHCTTILNESTTFRNKLCVFSFIILFYATLHVSAYKQAIFKCFLTNHKASIIRNVTKQLGIFV
jgi:hypothetical protein